MDSVNIVSMINICEICSFVLSSVLFAVFFKWILERRKLYLLSMKLPGPVALPFVGNICPRIQSVPRVLKRFEEESKKYSSPYRLWYGSKLVVVFTDPEQIKSVLTECYIPYKPGMFYYWSLGLGTGLLTGHGGGTWRRSRLLMNKAFEDFSITHYQSIVNNHAKKMVTKMEKLVGNASHDIGLNSLRYCFDIISETLLKEKYPKFQEDNLDLFIKLYQRVSTVSQKRATTCWLRSDSFFYYTNDYSLLERTKLSLKQFADDIYQRRKEEFVIAKKSKVLEEDDVPKTPMDIMLEAQYTGNRPFDDEIISEILNLYQAGADPTAACISFFILMLGIHGEIQDCLYGEISSYYKGKKISEEVKVEDLKNLKYLDMCMYEVMRMFPGNVFLAREVMTDVHMDEGIILPAGVKILIPSYMLNMSSRYWTDPTVFNPERFSDVNRANRNTYLFLPFGLGPRNCIGQQLGVNIIKTAIIHLLIKYKFHSDVVLKDVSVFVDMVTMKPENGYPVQIHPRM